MSNVPQSGIISTLLFYYFLVDVHISLGVQQWSYADDMSITACALDTPLQLQNALWGHPGVKDDLQNPLDDIQRSQISTDEDPLSHSSIFRIETGFQFWDVVIQEVHVEVLWEQALDVTGE